MAIKLKCATCGRRLTWDAERILDDLYISALHDCGGTWRKWGMKWPTDFEAVLFDDEPVTAPVDHSDV